MITPTMARRALTARSTTAERESPRSCTRKGGRRCRKTLRWLRGLRCVRRGPWSFRSATAIAVLIVQRNGVGAGGLDGRTNLLANGIEIDERTVRRAEGFAVLHRSATLRFQPSISTVRAASLM